MSECLPGHVPYASQALAANAVTLHQLAYPACTGFEVFPHRDHWHVGHPSKPVGAACKLHPEHLAARARIEGRGRRRRVTPAKLVTST